MPTEPGHSRTDEFAAFAELPDEARVWVYAADHELGETELAALTATMARFLPAWRSHGRPVNAAWSVVDGRFLVLAAWLTGEISGCGIDASVHALKRLRDREGLDLLPGPDVHYRGPDGPVTVTRRDFRALLESGEIRPDTLVYDTTIGTLGELRRGGLRPHFAESWHARAFRGA